MAEKSHYVILIDIKEVAIGIQNERSNTPTEKRDVIDKTHIVVKSRSMSEAVAKVKGILDFEIDNEEIN